MKNMRYIILAGSIFNIACGILVIFFLNYVAPLVDFDPLGNMLFTLFVGGTAITFGIGYIMFLEILLKTYLSCTMEQVSSTGLF